MSISVSRTANADRRPVAASLVLLALALAVPGCARRDGADPTSLESSSVVTRLVAPSPWDVAPGGEFGAPGRLPTPLAVGDRWEYVTRSRSVLVTDQGPQPPTISEDPLTTEITATARSGGRDYLLRVDTEPNASGPTQVQVLTRQDRSGLFLLEHPEAAASSAFAGAPAAASAPARSIAASADRAPADLAQRAAFQRAARTLAERVDLVWRFTFGTPAGVKGGPAPGEVSLLRFPLRIGASWDVGTTPPLVRSVVARERVSVPAGSFPAWRVHSIAEQFGPDDRLDLWYADAGLVKVSLHVEADARDGAGNVIGRIVGDVDQVLTGLRLVDRGGPLARATTPPAPAQGE